MFIRELAEPVIPQKFQKMLERDFEKHAKDTVQLVTRFKHLFKPLTHEVSVQIYGSSDKWWRKQNDTASSRDSNGAKRI